MKKEISRIVNRIIREIDDMVEYFPVEEGYLSFRLRKVQDDLTVIKEVFKKKRGIKKERKKISRIINWIIREMEHMTEYFVIGEGYLVFKFRRIQDELTYIKKLLREVRR